MIEQYWIRHRPSRARKWALLVAHERLLLMLFILTVLFAFTVFPLAVITFLCVPFVARSYGVLRRL